ncbi:MAG: D-alanine-D-alanine ligase [Planctomycetota bacterium]|jgi:D-alanine-D-alanine ligase
MLIAVAMGGPSLEHDISLESGRGVVDALREVGHNVEPLIVGQDGAFTFLGKTSSPTDATTRMKSWGVEAVFVTMHGRGGEDGHIQAWFEWAGIPYTGSGLASSALAMNKCIFKSVMVDRGLPTPKHLNILQSDWESDRHSVLERATSTVGFPAMLKVASAGSSYGVVMVHNQIEVEDELSRLFAEDDAVVWEACVAGDELTVPTYTDIEGRILALDVIQIIPQKGEFFDLASKYEDGGAKEIVPAPITEELAVQLKNLAIECHQLAGCRGLARTDFMVGKDGPMILEINTAPGLTPASLAPKAIAAAGLNFGRFYEGLILDARNRELLYRAGQDGTPS